MMESMPVVPAIVAPRTRVLAAWQRAYGGDATAECPALPGPLQPAQRPGADALAAWRRWHPPTLDDQFGEAEWPWYAVLERARVETLASRELPGMALNLADLDALAPAGQTAARLHRLARLSLASPPIMAAATLGEDERDTAGSDTVGKLGAAPPARTPFFTRLLASVRPRPVGQGAPPGPTDAEIVAALRLARPRLTDAAAFVEAVRPLVRALALSVAGDTAGDRPVPGPAPLTVLSLDAESDDASLVQEAETGNDLARTHSAADRRYPGYAIFSTRWDQTLTAAALYQPGDALHPHDLEEGERRQARRLALRLQRRLLAARLRRWSFDQDEGRLDSRRLARLLTPKPSYAVFRQEDESPVPEACVTLLVDQSGSMRGRPQRLTAQAIDLTVQTLEFCRVKCEVLGYTTRYGADNPLVRAWQTAGCPSAPGRLNALRHLVYKGADQPWRQCRPHLGLLLRPDLGRENLDGEALDWAARRLLRRPEPCKVLIVLSDGAPYDEATAAANGRRFLEDHLRAVIAALEGSPIRLTAIGAGQSVGRYYGRALTLHRPEEVATVLFDHLGDLLTRTAAEVRPFS
jgi:cobaltochelatase CobT